jgi:hypothetical protein
MDSIYLLTFRHWIKLRGHVCFGRKLFFLLMLFFFFFFFFFTFFKCLEMNFDLTRKISFKYGHENKITPNYKQEMVSYVTVITSLSH